MCWWKKFSYQLDEDVKVTTVTFFHWPPYQYLFDTAEGSKMAHSLATSIINSRKCSFLQLAQLGKWVARFTGLMWHFTFPGQISGQFLLLSPDKRKITKAMSNHPLGIMYICTKFHGNPFNSWWHLAVWTRGLTGIAIPCATVLKPLLIEVVHKQNSAIHAQSLLCTQTK